MVFFLVWVPGMAGFACCNYMSFTNLDISVRGKIKKRYKNFFVHGFISIFACNKFLKHIYYVVYCRKGPDGRSHF